MPRPPQPDLICGIDPGLSGALAFVVERFDVRSVHDMPIFEVARGGKAKRRELDGQALHDLLTGQPIAHAFVEQAQAMPGQAAYATGVFFQSYGVILGLLIGLRIPYTIVHPRTWKKTLSVPAGKDAARARASQLLPDAAGWWPLKKHDGRAEAALIAVWGCGNLAGARHDRRNSA